MRIDKDSQQLAEALERRAGADHHHDAAEVPVRARQDRRAARPPLRGDRRRGALLADRRGGQGSEAGARRRSSSRDRATSRRHRRGRGRPRCEQIGGSRAGSRTCRFFAFTATPKAQDAGAVRPAERPTRQATSRSTSTRCGRRSRRASSSTCCELHDLQDVLPASRRRSPTTRRTTRRRRARRIARFVTLHPHNLAQKAEIDRRALPAPRRATRSAARPRRWSSRSSPAARRALQAGARRVHQRAGLHGRRRARRLLRARCSTRRRRAVTEAEHERLPGDADRRACSTPTTYQVLLVAEKYQTGFDQPLLLRDVRRQAARRARTPCRRCPGSTAPTRTRTTRSSSTSATTPRTIRGGFRAVLRRRPSRRRPTRTCSTTPGTRSTSSACCGRRIATAFARLLLAERLNHARLHAALAPAIQRFSGLTTTSRSASATRSAGSSASTRSSPRSSPFADPMLERDYVYAKGLQVFIKAEGGAAVDLSEARRADPPAA